MNHNHLKTQNIPFETPDETKAEVLVQISTKTFFGFIDIKTMVFSSDIKFISNQSLCSHWVKFQTPKKSQNILSNF